MSIIKLFSLKEGDFLEIVKCINSLDQSDNDINLLKIAVKNVDLKLFKSQFQKIKNNFAIQGLKKQAGVVPAEYTYLTDIEMANVLLQAYKNVYGQIPNVQLLGLLWSQAAFETGQENGKFKLRNNNFGGVTAGNFDAKWNGSGWMASGKPYVKSPKSKMNFKAYSSPVAGAEEYIKTLGNLYPKSLEWKASGLIADDVLYMATKNYFGGEKIHAYGGGMDMYMHRFMNNVLPSIKEKLPAEPKPPPGAVSMRYKEYGDNPYLKNKENGLVNRKVFQSEKWAYDYKGKPVASEGVERPEAKPEAKPEEGGIKFDDVGGTDSGTKDSEDVNFEQTYQTLLAKLFACGPVERLVKKSLLRQKLAANTLLVTVKSELPRYVETRFARVLATALRNEMDAEISIHDGEHIEIECDVYGSPFLVKNAIYEVAEIINRKFNKLGDLNIDVKNCKSNNIILNEGEEEFRRFTFFALDKVFNGLRK